MSDSKMIIQISGKGLKRISEEGLNKISDRLGKSEKVLRQRKERKAIPPRRYIISPRTVVFPSSGTQGLRRTSVICNNGSVLLSEPQTRSPIRKGTNQQGGPRIEKPLAPGGESGMWLHP